MYKMLIVEDDPTIADEVAAQMRLGESRQKKPTTCET